MIRNAIERRSAAPVLATLLSGALLLSLRTAPAAARTDPLPPETTRPQIAPLGNLPVCFEARAGPAQFLARGHDRQLLLAPTSAQLTLCRVESAAPASPLRRAEILPRSARGWTRTVRLEFLGANPQARIQGEGELPGKINYLIGNDPARWQVGVATFARVQVQELYPGINLTYYGNQQQLEYDFAIAPGADPRAIAIHFDGADKVAVNEAGELTLRLGPEEIRQPQPTLYQMVAGVRKGVTGGYQLRDARTVRFSVGQYDQRLPLVIDPVLSYSSYLGGNVGDNALAIALDGQGNVYVAGETLSTAFPFTIPPGSYTNTFQGGTVNGDAFVAKFDNAASNLLYFTYLGGSGNDGAFSMTVDNAGHAFVTGFTESTNFPTFPTNALYPTIHGTPDTNTHKFPDDVFVTELDTNGVLLYSTYLGGSNVEVPGEIAVDAAGSAYVTGYTRSTDFPTVNAFQTNLGGSNSANAFVAKIGPGGTNLLYSSYLGGTNHDEGEGIAVFGTNFAFVAGYTVSTNFPTTTNALRRFLNGSTNATFLFDAFVAKFDTSLSGSNSLVYSTFLGGTNTDVATRIAVDASGNAYVTGYSESPDFPNTATNVPGLHHGVSTTNLVNSDAFLTKLTFNPNGAALVYSALFGGTNTEIGWDVAVETNSGDAYVIGITGSTNFPSFNTSGFLRATNSGGNDVFVTVFNADASALLYSVYLGGTRDDYGYGIATDGAGNAYITGRTLSTNFPTVAPVASPLQRTNNAFLAKISLGIAPQLSASLLGTNLQVRWPGFSPEFRLETTTNLAPPTTWSPVSQSPAASNGWETVTLPATNGAAFFRLHQP